MANPTLVPIPDNILDSLAETFQLVRIDPALVQLGQPVKAKVLPPTLDLKVPAVFTPVVNGVTGTPILVESPVSITVVWDVYAEDGITKLTDHQEIVLTDLPPGAQGLEASFLFAPIAFVELTNNLAVPLPVTRLIRATVTLSILDPLGNPIAGQSAILPDVTVLVPVIPIPTVIVLFRHANFAAVNLEDSPKAGAAVIAVPVDSPFRSLEELQQILGALLQTVSGLVQFPGMSLFLLALNALVNAVPPQPKVAFVAADSIGELGKIALFDVETPYTLGGIPIPGSDTAEDNVSANDQMSSLIMIGPPPVLSSGGFPLGKKPPAKVLKRRAVHLYNKRWLKKDLGEFTVNVDKELFVIVNDFANDLSADPPVSFPTGRVRVDAASGEAPLGGLLGPALPPSFDNTVSSLNFAWQKVVDISIVGPKRSGRSKAGFRSSRITTRRA